MRERAAFRSFLRAAQAPALPPAEVAIAHFERQRRELARLLREGSPEASYAAVRFIVDEFGSDDMTRRAPLVAVVTRALRRELDVT